MAKTGKNVYKRGERWYYRIEIDGREHRGVLAGAQTEAEAVALAAEKRAALTGVPTGPLADAAKVSIDELFDAYFDEYCPANIRASTAKRYEGSARPLLAFFSGRAAAGISRRDLTAYAQARMRGFAAAGVKFEPVKSMTVRRDLATLSGVFKHALSAERIAANPVAKYDTKHLPNSETRVRWLTDAQFAKLVAEAHAISPELADMVTFAGHTGLRWGEQFAMLWDWIDVLGKTLHVPGSVTKTGQPRSIPLDDRAMGVIYRREQYRHLCRYVFFGTDTTGHRVRLKHHEVSRPFNVAVFKAGLSDFHWHDLRHHCASRWVRNGADLYPVSRLLGHSTVTQSEKYAHLASETLRSVVDRAPST